jgi:hypothetical protein
MALFPIVIKTKKSQVVKVYSDLGELYFTCKSAKDRAGAIANFDSCKLLSSNASNFALVTKSPDNQRYILNNSGMKRQGSQVRCYDATEVEEKLTVLLAELPNLNIP